MTRTERATSLRAILKDRSEPRNAMGKEFIKGGAGPHNWGSLVDERELEEAALEDAEQREQGQETDTAEPTAGRKASVSMSPEERQKALNFRKNAFKSPNVDLASIARTSGAVSHSPTDTTAVTSDADPTRTP
ncbi:hypothetical protein PHLGIDRAFT_19880 [Phlebiopsis gigantea 11061_1 CR5-6]|uniref:Hyaluronan/mRNA-binding protein domain-containing protein n=1 Tax=Phlebiopsis gigantea (strain 11061_1 CR5-6) TaxID=745531 RepID=A0A0C3NIX4_PHLG1|nr:hypothetical protein PHLGIDRAFT_19880 [Phlebiopsis gigantea 11061_1 CR5-6]